MSLIRSSFNILLLALVFSPTALAQQLPREQWGAPAVNVSHSGGKWIISGNKNQVTLNESDLAMKKLVHTGREIGYSVIFHDQYRTYYLDSPSYDLQFAIHEEDAAG